MMRLGLFKPVHLKTLIAQEQRMLLTSRKLIQRKLMDVEWDMRGTLRNFGLKVGTVGTAGYDVRIRHLVEGFPRLEAIVEPLLTVRCAMRQQLAVLHKMLLDTVRDDPVCRQFMTAPGVMYANQDDGAEPSSLLGASRSRSPWPRIATSRFGPLPMVATNGPATASDLNLRAMSAV
jgi:hypothetical protein